MPFHESFISDRSSSHNMPLLTKVVEAFYESESDEA
jgi:hypothetical protein